MVKKAKIQTQNGEISITQAKGRPMLVWVGKRPLTRITPYPAQHVETSDPTGAFGKQPAEPEQWNDWPSHYPKGGLLFHGDNKEVLAHLLSNGFRGKVNLVYIDPPFDSGADYIRKVTLRGVKGSAKIDGENYTLGEQIQYTDIWANDNYLQFMYERLLLIKELLSENGTIYLHCDPKKSHQLRSILDEIFGPDNFMNEVLWVFRERGISKTAWNTKHNNIFVYTKNLGEQTFNVDKVRDSYSEETIKKFKYQDENGRYQIRGRNIPGSPIRQADGLRPEHEQQYPGLTYRQYMEEGQLPLDWWEIPLVNKAANERVGYPTQKPEEILYKIICASSNPGDIILDCFLGSGTTIAVAQKLGRRWIGCDINKGSIQTTVKRLQDITAEQVAENTTIKVQKAQKKITDDVVDTKPDTDLHPSLGFTVWRVNDYDLQIQHNEAVQLACDIIGIQRIRTDSFFEGILGKQLVKIIPFGHPLNPLDLEEIKRELESRPDEERNVTVVCLGMELAAKGWVEEWNRLRKGKDAINKINVIELRTDERYGKFIRHEPAQAKVSIQRKSDKILVEINDFISPTIIQRLSQSEELVKPIIKSWQSMVDYVMIDPTYDGKIFNISLSDMPEKKDMVVEGKYEFPAPKGKTTVAIKIVDMLGEEVLVTKEV